VQHPQPNGGKIVLAEGGHVELKIGREKNHMKKLSILLAGLGLSVVIFAYVLDNRFTAAFGPLFHPSPNVPPLVGPRHGLDSLHRWNLIAINATCLDHTPVAPGENRVFGEQLGPGRSSRAMAIVHIAMFDALEAVVGGYTSYTGTQAAHGPMSVDAAISQAAHDTWRRCSHRKRRLLMRTLRKI
jgi:hypothetical protein